VTNQNGHIQSDQALVQQVLNGNTQAFGQLLKQTERLVAQILFKLVSNPEDRKDLAQDVYLKVHRNLAAFQFQSKLSTWVAQIAYHTCTDYLRKKKLLLLGDDFYQEDESRDLKIAGFTATVVETTIDQKELKTILQTGLSKLSPIYQTLISLYHQEEMSYGEIVQITGLPEGTVKNYLFRARKALKNELLQMHKKEDL
jgi:RNA polymerase sigma factor (sigma-70 family)